MFPWIIASSLLIAAPGPNDAPKKESPLVGQWRLGERPALAQVDTFAADGTCIIRTRIPGMRKGEQAREVEDSER